MNSDPLFLVMVGYGALVVFMLVLWGVQLVHRNASIADVGFCAGLIVVVLWYARYGFGDPERKLFVAAMVCVYAGRLGLFLLFNRVIGKAEDARYQEMRRSWGASVASGSGGRLFTPISGAHSKPEAGVRIRRACRILHLDHGHFR
jgi:steroid 5-alpha reductase family enzyme